MPSCSCVWLSEVSRGIDGEGDADFVGEVAAVGVGVGDDDVARPGVAGDGGGHDADGAGTGDEDVFAEDGEGERGVDGVAEGIEDGGDFERDAGGVPPDVGHGQDDELGEGAVAIDADADGVGAEMAAAGEAVAAASADDVAFAGDDVAGEKSATLEPTSTISPTNSWPMMRGTGMVFCAQASHS